MNNDNPELNPAAEVAEPTPYTGVTPGQLLREVREARGQSVAEVAAALRLRVSVIEAIEADDYEPLKGSTFVRGYFRSLAKLYDIDPQPLAEAYEAMGYGAPSVSTLKMQSFSRRKIREKNDSRLMLVSYLIIAGVIGAAGWWWWQQPPAATVETPQRSVEVQQTDADIAAQLEAERLAADQAEAERQAQQGEPLTEQQLADQAALDQAALEQAEAERLAAEQTEAERLAAERAAQLEAARQTTEQAANLPAPLTQTAGTDALTLVFSQQCWVKVTDASGRDIAIGVKEAGYEMPLNGQAPFDIILCKPEAVAMTYNGEAVDLSQYRRNRSVTLRVE